MLVCVADSEHPQKDPGDIAGETYFQIRECRLAFGLGWQCSICARLECVTPTTFTSVVVRVEGQSEFECSLAQFSHGG